MSNAANIASLDFPYVEVNVDGVIVFKLYLLNSCNRLLYDGLFPDGVTRFLVSFEVLGDKDSNKFIADESVVMDAFVFGVVVIAAEGGLLFLSTASAMIY